MTINTAPLNTHVINAPGGASGGGGGSFGVGSFSVALSLSTFARGEMGAALSLAVVPPRGKLAASMRLSVFARGKISAALALNVTPRAGKFSVPLALDVFASGKITVPMALGVYAPGGAQGAWAVRVLLDGLDVSARVTGAGSVDAEESAARIADFELLPFAGSVNPFTWVGANVSIDFAYSNSGWRRLFTGVVETPAYDPIEASLRMRCTDDRQGVLRRASRASLDAIIGGRWSAFIFEDGANDVYADDRLSTTPAALDMSPHGALRSTAWAAKTVADVEYAEDEILEESLGLDLVGRSQIHNVVNLAFDYRYPRLRGRTWAFRWDHPDYPFLALVLANASSFPTKEMCASAIEGAGWDVQYINMIELPPSQWVNLGNGNGFSWGIEEDVRTTLTWSVRATLSKRWGQSATETWAAVVKAPDSISTIGELSREEQASVEVDFDLGAWEADASVSPILDTPSVSLGTLTGETSFDLTDQDADGLDAAQDAYLAKVDQVSAGIQAVHRLTRVRAAIALNPDRDLTDTVRIATARLTAKGKCAGVRHSWNIDNGEATTELTLAISTVGATGLASSDPVEAPEQPEKPASPDADPSALITYADTLLGTGSGSTSAMENLKNGYVGNTLGSDAAGAIAATEEFRVTPPDISEEDRDPLSLGTQQEFLVAIPQDELTIAA